MSGRLTDGKAATLDPGGAPDRSTRILVADDQDGVRRFVGRALRKSGHHVELAKDGLAALEALAAEPFDLLIADIVMPGLDGVELALKAAKDYPDMPVLLITGYAAQHQRAHGLDHLIHGVLSKPFSLRQIQRAADTALATRPRTTYSDSAGPIRQNRRSNRSM